MVTKTTRKQKPVRLPEGLYKTQVAAVMTGPNAGQLTLYLDVKNFRPDGDSAKDSLIKAQDRFLIIYHPAKLYTTIAAKNIHHAINKATRDCSGRYTSIQDGSNVHREQALMALGFTFLPLAKYNKAVQADLLTEV